MSNLSANLASQRWEAREPSVMAHELVFVSGGEAMVEQVRGDKVPTKPYIV
jgi:hypothetical protein